MDRLSFESIGQNATFQDPRKALESAYGAYRDPVGLPNASRFPNLPAAPQPTPYTVTGSGSGSR